MTDHSTDTIASPPNRQIPTSTHRRDSIIKGDI